MSRGTIGIGTDAERLRILELYVSDHEGDLTQWANDMRDLRKEINRLQDANQSFNRLFIGFLITSLTILGGGLFAIGSQIIGGGGG